MSKNYIRSIACKKESCFAYYKRKCNILNDTNFKGKPCPFYKPREEKK